jgi:hypothetical protein
METGIVTVHDQCNCVNLTHFRRPHRPILSYSKNRAKFSPLSRRTAEERKEADFS